MPVITVILPHICNKFTTTDPPHLDNSLVVVIKVIRSAIVLAVVTVVSHTGILTAAGDVQNDADVNIEVLWLDSEVDGAMLLKCVGTVSWITVHLCDRIKAMFSLHCHLTVALVTVGRCTQEVIHTQRTLHTRTHRGQQWFFKLKNAF